jgi:hypothetical protein
LAVVLASFVARRRCVLIAIVHLCRLLRSLYECESECDVAGSDD